MSTPDLDRATARLSALVEQGSARARATRLPVIISLTEPAAVLDPLDALEAVGAFDDALCAPMRAERSYWACPAADFALAGVGAAVTLSAAGPDRFKAVDQAWMALRESAVVDDPSGGIAGVGPILMGGFAFAPDGPRTALWEGFPAALLTLPRLQFASIRGECWVTMTLRVGVDGRPDIAPNMLARFRARAMEAAAHAARPGRPSTHDAIDFENSRPASEWRQLVRDATGAIRSRVFEKVVLAREVHATAACTLDAAAAVRHLRATVPGCYIFGLWRGDRAFVGASPERLVRLDARDLRSSSVAGSIRRGATPDEDAVLVAQLLASPKERREQELVRAALCAGLEETCDAVTAPTPPHVLTLPHVHHLHTPVRARLRPGVSLLDVVARLHPTPAVAGAPREAALRFIDDHEHLDRGWYAGPIGWLGADCGEFAVALRSALVSGGEAWLFAGCGVVADSNAEREYDETLLKLRSMQLALAASEAAGRSGPLGRTAAAPANGEG